MSKYELKKFADVLTIVNGKNQRKVENKNGHYPIYGSGGVMGYADDFICEENTVIIGRKGSINNPIFVKEKFWNVDTAFGLCAKNNILLPKYLYYFCKKYNFEKLNTTVTIPSLTKANLLKVKIPLRALEEQKRIADILDKASNLIDLRKQQLEKMDLLIKSKFIDMLGDPVTNSKGWEVKSLKDIALGKLSYGAGASATEYDLNVRYIRITDINEKGCLNVHKVSPNEISDEYILSEGDILFARSGATVGKTFRYSEKYGKCIYAGYLIRLVPNQKIVLPDYIYYLTKTDYYLSFVQQSMKTVAQPNINAQQYGALQIPIPPIFLQNQFAAFVEQVEKQKAVMQQSLEKMETNYKALMQEYFG